MRRLWLVGLLACSAGVARAEKEKLVVLDLVVTDSSSTAAESPLVRLAAAAVEQLLTELAANDRLEPIGKSDMNALLGLERQKQLLGCGEASSSCLAEISGALGAPWVLAGALSRVGDQLRLDLKLLRASEGRAVARAGELIRGENDLFPALSRALSQVLRTANLEATPRQTGPVLPWVLTGLGGASVITGAILLGVQASQTTLLQAKITNGEIDVPAAQIQRSAIYGQRTTGGVLVGVGAAALAGGLIWGLAGKQSATTVAVVPAQSGASLCVGGAW